MKRVFMFLLCLFFLFALVACSAGDPCVCSEYDYATYSIYYHANGGTLATFNPVAYNAFTPTFTLNNPTRDGYRFLGWSVNEDLSNPTVTLEVPIGTTGDLHFYATWGQLFSVKVNTSTPEFFTISYPVQYVLYGGTAVVHIKPASPIAGLQWFSIGAYQEPDTCVFNEELGCFVVRFTLTKSINIMVNAKP